MESSSNVMITDRIKDVSINALLLAKYNKAEEAKISLQIQEDSFLNELPDCITCDELGSVIGNILENSMDAVKNDGTGIIKFRIYEKEGNLNIYIKNNGCEIPHNIRADIYKPGITTKEGMGGYGMYVVKKIVEEAQGQIAFTCSEGTEWSISIPMKRG